MLVTIEDVQPQQVLEQRTASFVAGRIEVSRLPCPGTVRRSKIEFRHAHRSQMVQKRMVQQLGSATIARTRRKHLPRHVRESLSASAATSERIEGENPALALLRQSLPLVLHRLHCTGDDGSRNIFGDIRDGIPVPGQSFQMFTQLMNPGIVQPDRRFIRFHLRYWRNPPRYNPTAMVLAGKGFQDDFPAPFVPANQDSQHLSAIRFEQWRGGDFSPRFKIKETGIRQSLLKPQAILSGTASRQRSIGIGTIAHRVSGFIHGQQLWQGLGAFARHRTAGGNGSRRCSSFMPPSSSAHPDSQCAILQWRERSTQTPSMAPFLLLFLFLPFQKTLSLYFLPLVLSASFANLGEFLPLILQRLLAFRADGIGQLPANEAQGPFGVDGRTDERPLLRHWRRIPKIRPMVHQKVPYLWFGRLRAEYYPRRFQPAIAHTFRNPYPEGVLEEHGKYTYHCFAHAQVLLMTCTSRKRTTKEAGY